MLGLLIIFFDNQSIKLEENSTITSFAFNISNYRLTMPILRLLSLMSKNRRDIDKKFHILTSI